MKTMKKSSSGWRPDWFVFPILAVFSFLFFAHPKLYAQESTQFKDASTVRNRRRDPEPVGKRGKWKLIFRDEFSRSSLNTSTWTPGWLGVGTTGPVNSSETTCYDSAQVTLPGDGNLHLHFLAKQQTCGSDTRPYTGSLISSNPDDGVAGHKGFQYTYGYVEFRVYLPPASGAIANWPGTWSDGQSWPTDGENDTMEGLGGNACFHFHSPSGGPGDCAAGNYSGWHTFASDWEPGFVKYYYDGRQVGEITIGITPSPQYLILEYTQGAYGGKTIAPADMLVDYVRVWQTPKHHKRKHSTGERTGLQEQ